MGHPIDVRGTCRALAGASLLLIIASTSGAETSKGVTFELDGPAEVQAMVTARCEACDWGRRGREAAVIIVTLDGREPQDLVLARGPERAEYAVALGPASKGRHRVELALDHEATPPAARDVVIETVRIVAIPPRDRRHVAAAYAPMLYPRPDAHAAFSDLPLLLWYEVDALPSGGRRIRYSVVFSNEDGGTPADRLMATWGRLTDIEFVYGIELDAAGRVVSELIQGNDHKIVPFRGRRLGRHPLLWVVTENNMVADAGPGRRRVAPAPFEFDLTAVSREAVMDAQPWTYRVSSQEAFREGRVREGAVPGSKEIVDPRRFVYLEACAALENADLTFAVGAIDEDARIKWYESNGDEPRYRIRRVASEFPNGCFRGAVALPARITDGDIRRLRFRAYTRTPEKGEAALPAGSGRARITRVNRLFRLGEDYGLGRTLLAWTGDLPIEADGPPAELPASAGW